MLMSHYMKNDNFDVSQLDTWPTGTMHRLLTVIAWADNLYSTIATAFHGTPAWDPWMGRDGSGGTRDIMDSLSHQLTSRAALRQMNRKEAEIWVTNFHSAIMDAMRVETVSNDPEVRMAFPASIRQSTGLPIVCWKYSIPTGIVISNERSTVMQAHKHCHRRCECAKVHSRYKDKSGHVATTDLNVVRNDTMRHLMQKGTTFRDEYEWWHFDEDKGPGPSDPEEIRALQSSIDEYIKRCSELNDIAPCYFQEWRNLLLTKLRSRYKEVQASAIQPTQERRQETADRRHDYEKYCEQFRKRYAIITGDKAKNTYCIVCKTWICQQIITETQTTTTYATANKTESQITEEDYAFCKEEGLVTMTVQQASKLKQDDPKPPKHTWFHERIPTFGVSLKMHKQNALRFMAKSHDTSLTQLSTWMSRTLKAMSGVSEDIWRTLFRTVGIHTHSSWIISNSRQVRQRMDRMQAAGLQPHAGGQQTYDFATMYTSLQLKSIKRKMYQYIDLVFEHQRHNKDGRGEERVLEVNLKGFAKWQLRRDTSQRDKHNKKYITAERAKRWIKKLLKRLFVKVGDKVMKQVIGLPMGTSCSPFLANLVLFMYEFEFFTEAISKLRPWHDQLPDHPLHGQHNLIRKLSFCTRYIDDLWNPLVDKATFQSIVKKMYPDWLKLGLEGEGSSVHYLDMTISFGDTQWESKLYDKKATLVQAGLKLNKFPHPESKLSERCKYGVVTSQLHRYAVACSNIKHFMESATELYSAYVKKGYRIPNINYYFERFIRNNMTSLSPRAVQSKYWAQQGRRRQNE